MLEKLIQDLIKYKVEHELTQYELADLLDVKQSAISRMLNRQRNPSAAMIERIEELVYGK